MVNFNLLGTNKTDDGASKFDLALQSKICLLYLKDLYESNKHSDILKIYSNLDIDQNFIKEVLQEIEFVYSSKKSKNEKKTFDSIQTKNKSAFSKFMNKIKNKNSLKNSKKVNLFNYLNLYRKFQKNL